jgi:hypothetical protein
VRLRDETVLTVPAWMSDEIACAYVREVRIPCIALAALLRLRCLLDETQAQSAAHATQVSSSTGSGERHGPSATAVRLRPGGKRASSAAAGPNADHPPARAVTRRQQPKQNSTRKK